MSSETPDPEPNPGPYVGALMRVGWQFVWDRIHSGVLADGYDDLNPAHIGAFRYPTLDRQRPSALADQLQITKQSVNDLLGHLEQRGYLTREPDSADGRARVIHLTSKGRKLEKVINAQAKAAELEIAHLLGSRDYAQLRHALERLASEIKRSSVSPRP